jgi:hypothetical protein
VPPAAVVGDFDMEGHILTLSNIRSRRNANAPAYPAGAWPIQRAACSVDGMSSTDGGEVEEVRRRHLESLLDEALEESFPASDPPAVDFEASR